MRWKEIRASRSGWWSSSGLHQDSTLDFSNDLFIFNVGVSKLYSSQNEVISDQACRMWIPFFLVVFQSMSEPEQPEPEVAEAGPGNAGNACFVRLMPDLLQFPSTDIHGQNVTVYIHVTRMSQCILENCRRVRTEYMRPRCQKKLQAGTTRLRAMQCIKFNNLVIESFDSGKVIRTAWMGCQVWKSLWFILSKLSSPY